MTISQVTLVPGCGFSDDLGGFDPGLSGGSFLEVDLISEITNWIEEELEPENIRCTVLETRRKPGFKLSERHEYIDKSSLVLHIRGGYFERENVNADAWYNGSAIYYRRPADLELADILMDTMGEWGHCAAYGHKKARPIIDKKDPILSRLDTPCFRLEPFFINGPNVDDYWRAIPELGRDIALAISQYLKERGFANSRMAKPAMARK